MKEAFTAFVLTVAVPAFVYLMGFIYLTGYYGYFGVNLSEIDLGVYEILSHAIVAFFPALQQFYLLILLFGIATFLIQLLRGKKALVSAIHASTVAFIVLAALSISFSKSVGEKYAKSDLRNLSRYKPNYDLTTSLSSIFANLENVEFWHLRSSKNLTILIGTSSKQEVTERIYKWVIRVDRKDWKAEAVYQRPR